MMGPNPISEFRQERSAGGSLSRLVAAVPLTAESDKNNSQRAQRHIVLICTDVLETYG